MNKSVMGTIIGVVIVVITLFMMPLIADLTTADRIDALESKLNALGYTAYLSAAPGDWTVTGDAEFQGDVEITGLTAGRVVTVGVGDVLTDDAQLTYDAATDTLTTSHITAPTGRSATYVVAASDAPAHVKAQADLTVAAVGWETDVQTAITANAGGNISFIGTFTKGTIAGFTIPSNTCLDIQGNWTYITDVGNAAIMFAPTSVSNINIIGSGWLNGNRANQAVGTQNGIVLTTVTNSKIDIGLSGFKDKAIVSTGGIGNSIINRLYPSVDPTQVAPSLMGDMLQSGSIKLIDVIDDDATWTVYHGTLEWSSDEHVVGTSCAKVITSYGASPYRCYARKTLASPIVINPKNFLGMFVKIPEDAGYNTGFYLTFKDSASVTARMNVSQYTVVPSYRIEGNWLFMGIIPGDSFPLVDWNAIKYLEIEMYSTVGTAYYYLVDGIYEVESMYPHGSITITVDDQDLSAYSTIFPIMAKYGFAGVSYVNANAVDTVGNRTTAQLKEMYDVGWDISNHGWNHQDFSTITLGEAEEEVLKNKNWIIEKGFGNRDISYAYSYGHTTEAAFDLVAQYYPITRYTAGSSTDIRSTTMFEPHNIRSIRLTDASLADCETAIDNAVASGGHFIFDFHHAKAGGDISVANFTTFIEYAANAGVKVVTFSEIADSLRYRAVTNAGNLDSVHDIQSGEVRNISGTLTKTDYTFTTVTGTFTETGSQLKPGANTVHCTVTGTAKLDIPTGCVAVAASVGGGATVTGSPKTLSNNTAFAVTAGGTNEFTITITHIAFALHNPEAQDVFIKKIVVNITTKGGTATATMDVGIADDAVGTNLGAEFFDDIDVDAAAAVHDSWLAGDGGSQTKWVLVQDSVSATDGWIVGKIITEIADGLVGTWYVEYCGK